MGARNRTRAEIIDNHKLETLYSNDFEQGRFFKIVFQDEFATKIQLSSKTYMQVVYKPNRNDIESIEILKLVGEEEKEKVSFSKFNFQQLKSFELLTYILFNLIPGYGFIIYHFYNRVMPNCLF